MKHHHHHHHGNPAPIERATITSNNEWATVGGPGDSLSEALIEATLKLQLARARLQAVTARLQEAGGTQKRVGGSIF